MPGYRNRGLLLRLAVHDANRVGNAEAANGLLQHAGPFAHVRFAELAIADGRIAFSGRAAAVCFGVNGEKNTYSQLWRQPYDSNSQYSITHFGHKQSKAFFRTIFEFNANNNKKPVKLFNILRFVSGSNVMSCDVETTNEIGWMLRGKRQRVLGTNQWQLHMLNIY